ncbi:MAG: DUF3460 domain-containing protein [Betaproteobacteria bacterium HGW-Betaproteobacteria-11]|nr:MAG: DUF3460 domain-containing protein [Betaproteobacteria bacterium HGW-Betaproteobacteria-11]
MSGYESEHTRFIHEWMEAHPEERLEQQKGRALWWDKPPRTAEEVIREQVTQVPVKAYYYDVN